MIDILEWSEFACAYDLIEHNLVSGILAGWPDSIAIADTESCDPSLILDNGLRLIYVAAITAGPQSLGEVLDLARDGMQHYGEWEGWSDGLLADFAITGDAENVQPLSETLVNIHKEWNLRAWWDGPKFCAPPSLGQLSPIRIGLALRRLSEISGVPLSWVHGEFSRACVRRDRNIGLLPDGSSSPVGKNRGSKTVQWSYG